jgi:hypothetical protein
VAVRAGLHLTEMTETTNVIDSPVIVPGLGSATLVGPCVHFTGRWDGGRECDRDDSMPPHVAQYLVYRDGAMRVVEAVGDASGLGVG